MGERKDLPKIIPQEKPTIFNREAGGWGIAGGMVGDVAGSFTRNAATKSVLVYAGTAAGALYGGLKGKARQQKEQVEGRVVKKPTVWNGGIWNGLFVAGLVCIPFASIFEKAAQGAINSIPLLTAVSSLVVVAPIVGSVMRKNSMKRDLKQAEALRDEQQAKGQGIAQEITAGQGQEQPLSYKNSVSPAEAAALAEKQAEKSQAHVAAMEAAQAHAQQPAAARA